ncbi:Transcriptional activator Myb [Astathelohania contejeani]|uniref:Transcriptional activator Myb n=1 Tax=Astathelohania contejeani TaxID=164912 RepID=A0ABQ7I0N3_9MICR|nr:Transcriptional activator Myb [Thelohania contejeani]
MNKEILKQKIDTLTRIINRLKKMANDLKPRTSPYNFNKLNQFNGHPITIREIEEAIPENDENFIDPDAVVWQTIQENFKYFQESKQKYKLYNIWFNGKLRKNNSSVFGTDLATYVKSLQTGKIISSKSRWSKEDDNRLKIAIERNGAGNWKYVSKEMGDKTPSQCLHRYRCKLKPGLKNGRWSEEEDAALIEGVKLYGEGRWSKIQRIVKTRTDGQCRERWINVINKKQL